MSWFPSPTVHHIPPLNHDSPTAPPSTTTTAANSNVSTPVASPQPSSPSLNAIFSDLAEASTISPSSLPPSNSSASPASISPILHLQNVHSMQTRAKRGIVKPRLNPTLLLTHMEPTSIKQALIIPHWL
ncbi:hypothetical protein KIW84_023397 [Lathyrus oleraceus]|uniref:Uncharacterized protein n=1 Tax=Pisum sativum TaxID=3888 RepID=A0A9D4YGR2_PEA|nr:hypothetical protein KIW84_023397 [Pisum sativum]